jgi:ribosomal protein S18 acetylase RimI-like enzyme
MSEPIVRAATEADAPAIADIWESGWHDAHDGNVPDELVRVRDSASFRRRTPGRIGDTSVAEVDGEIAGFVMLLDDEVEQVYVSSRHRGAGVADALMADADARLRAAGHARAWLAVVAGNARARRFYERHGWTDDGPFEHHAPGPNGPVRVPAHRYVKEL